MDGYEATRQILHTSPAIKIIVQTAYADDISRSLEAGCIGFISKPFTKNQFVKMVNENL
jgi:CheY-like chemotaxis protein